MEELDTHNLLVNDQEATEVHSTIAQLSRTNLLGELLGSKPKDAYSSNEELKERLTLRNCNSDYFKFGGYKYGNSELPEFDRCITKGCISVLRAFDNMIGHFVKEPIQEYGDCTKTICLKPEILPTMKELSESVQVGVGSSIRKGKLWCLEECDMCYSLTADDWQYGFEVLSTKLCTALNVISVSFPAPLSAHSQHAWLESQDSRSAVTSSNIFKQPEETTSVTGLLGTLQNNQIIDLAQDDSKESIDIELRNNNFNVPGFLCSGHTAHSTEAGRIRRVCDKVSIRILNITTLRQLSKCCEISDRFSTDKKEWLLFCMGKMTYCSTRSIFSLRNLLASVSSNSLHMPTMHINYQTMVALVSISSGVLVRRDLNNLLVTSTSVSHNMWADNKYIPSFPEFSSNKALEFYFSTYFQLTPFMAQNRPPRSLISSVQSIQAVATPYGAGTSSVAPPRTTKPLVSTEFLESVLDNPSSGIPDNMPGEDLVVCFANFNDTNEDSIMMSESSIGRGLFAYMGYSVHVVNPNEKIPEDGEYAHIKNNAWWKTYSRRQYEPPAAIQTKSNKKPLVPLLAGGDGRGKVISRNTTQSGQISVKMLRYSTPVTGDKLAAGHGQKGVIKLVPDTDMPWGIDDRNEPIKFDIVMSLSSMTNRLTNGMYYEVVSGVKAAKECRRLIIQPTDECNDHTETILYSGETGQIIDRKDEDEDVPVLASWGICRIWQMTQLTWDKQHYVHSTAGNTTITTTTGRTAGGGIKFGEMETHAIEASGLTKPCKEIVSRIDLIDVQVCTHCDELVTTCLCGNQRLLVNVSVPHSMIIFAESNLLITGYVTKFKVSF